MSIGGNINVNFLFDDVESGETIVTNLLSLLGKVQELSYYDREIDETIILEGQTNLIHTIYAKQYPSVKLTSDFGDECIFVSWKIGKAYMGVQIDIPLIVLGQKVIIQKYEKITQQFISLAQKLFQRTPYFIGFANHEHDIDVSIERYKTIDYVQSFNPSILFIPINGELIIEYGEYYVDGITRLLNKQ